MKETDVVVDRNLMYGDLNEIAEHIAARYRLETPALGKPSLESPKPVTLSLAEVQRMPEAFSLALWPGRAEYPGVRVNVRVPFTGDPELFQYQPSEFNLNPPAAEVDRLHRQVIFTFNFLEGRFDPAQFLPVAATLTQPFQWWLEKVAAEVRPFNESLPTQLVHLLERRRSVLVATHQQAETHGFAVDFDPVQAARLLVQREQLHTLTIAQTSPLPQRRSATLLPEQDYQLVLDGIDDFARQLERGNRMVGQLGEEALRDVLLAGLNMLFRGQVSGETFNRRGKTDILIRQGNDIAFLGECKFWGGSKLFTETVDQLLNYLTSRDLLTALIIFNRNKNGSDVVENVLDRIRNHPQYLKDVAVDVQRRILRFQFQHGQDDKVSVDVAVLVYDL
ncbi:hypothetical protein [Deinococcus aquaticus]|uniref:Restriction endonuclease n=1 Tax=Deinococcus aquaticus TaxID=328692 RepID=A0ABY7V6Z3_9DEIO|nr:hypothetical protein [Deinococcus aquaticus]WDA60606.1 hypothetical protein M8445_17870 [Deinococcus aquaticus]